MPLSLFEFDLFNLKMLKKRNQLELVWFKTQNTVLSVYMALSHNASNPDKNRF